MSGITRIHIAGGLLALLFGAVAFAVRKGGGTHVSAGTWFCVSMLVLGRLSARQRIARHLWRMCFAFFIATGSFFLGQQDVLPQAVRGSPILFVLAFVPFALMLFWLARLRSVT